MEAITGVPEINRKLRNLERKAARKVGRKAVNKGLTVLAKAIRSKAPRKLRPIVGKRHKKNRNTKEMEAKAGVAVGMSKKKKEKFGERWYLFLQATGTRDRKTRRGGRRGRLVAKTFVPEAFAASKSSVLAAMENTLKQNLESEAVR